MNWFWWRVFELYTIFPTLRIWSENRAVKKAEKELNRLLAEKKLKGNE